MGIACILHLYEFLLEEQPAVLDSLALLYSWKQVQQGTFLLGSVTSCTRKLPAVCSKNVLDCLFIADSISSRQYNANHTTPPWSGNSLWRLNLKSLTCSVPNIPELLLRGDIVRQTQSHGNSSVPRHAIKGNCKLHILNWKLINNISLRCTIVYSFKFWQVWQHIFLFQLVSSRCVFHSH